MSSLAGRREQSGRESGDWRPFDHVDDEVAVALTLTRRSAARLLDLALGLDRLPLTRAALAAGLIDERRAEVIAEEVAGLDDEHAAAVEKLIIGRAPELTSGQLRALVRRAVLSADPRAARRRKEKALKDARVEMFPETSGTAALAGRDLPPAAVLAADKHLTALAQAMKAAGQPGTLDILRARAYLHLLSGQPATTLLCAQQAAATPGLPGSIPPAGPELPLTAPDAAVPASGGLRGSVNLTMPLSAWLGWTQSPGDVPGYGPVDAEDSRTLADQLAANPASQWCVTLTGTDGHPVAHACARHGPPVPGQRASPASPGPRATSQPGPQATSQPYYASPGLAARPDLHHLRNRDMHPPAGITGLPAQPVTAPPHPDPQPRLHRPRLPQARHPLRPGPRHPPSPRRAHLRMQRSSRVQVISTHLGKDLPVLRFAPVVSRAGLVPSP